MVFSSLVFLYAFLPLSLLAYYRCKRLETQNIALLAASLIFYAWGEPKYVLLLMFMALVNWYCALNIKRAHNEGESKMWVAIAVAADLLLIGFFKYSGLFCSVFGKVPDFISKIALPIGISFYTFQLMTYVVDVHRGEAEAQESYWNVLLYAALFHQCIAGPIVRYKTIAEELFVHREAGNDLLPGIRRFTVGLAKKALLANPCGALADSLLLSTDAAADVTALASNIAALKSLTVVSAWVGVLAFMLQIYLDFSAYSDMAIGMGKMLGLHYLENFNYPYIAKSVTEFWRRWHISLGTFFRDYVYIPLGGNRVSVRRHVVNLLIVWLLTGLWHGANWNFMFWGLYFCLFLILEKFYLRERLESRPALAHVYTLLVVFFGWIIFHFTDMRLGFTVFKGLFGLNGNKFSDFLTGSMLSSNLFLLIVSAVACLPVVPKLNKLCDALTDGSEKLTGIVQFVIDCVVPVGLLLLSTAALVGDSYNPFIYFQF